MEVAEPPCSGSGHTATSLLRLVAPPPGSAASLRTGPVSPVDPYLRLKFEGGRFEGHAMPVDVLAEFVTMQDLVQVVARQMFLKANPTRVRAPRGFNGACKLHLAATEPNCFTADLVLASHQPQAEHWAMFDDARAWTMKALHAAAAAGPPPPDVPDALGLLSQLGRHLVDQEIIGVSGNGKSATLDARARSSMQAWAPEDYRYEAELEGEVVAVDEARERFTLSVGAGRFDVPLLLEHATVVNEAMRERPIRRVLVKGSLLVRKSRLETLESFLVLDADRASEVTPLWDRIEDLHSRLRDGWLDGRGVAISAAVAERTRRLVGRLLVDHDDAPAPRIYPTDTGGIQLEWDLRGWSAELLVEKEEILGEALHLADGRESARAFSTETSEQGLAAPLASWLRSLQ